MLREISGIRGEFGIGRLAAVGAALFVGALLVPGVTPRLQWFNWVERPLLWKQVVGSCGQAFELDMDSPLLTFHLNEGAAQSHRRVLEGQVPGAPGRCWSGVGLRSDSQRLHHTPRRGPLSPQRQARRTHPPGLRCFASSCS